MYVSIWYYSVSSNHILTSCWMTTMFIYSLKLWQRFFFLNIHRKLSKFNTLSFEANHFKTKSMSTSQRLFGILTSDWGDHNLIDILFDLYFKWKQKYDILKEDSNGKSSHAFQEQQDEMTLSYIHANNLICFPVWKLI